MTNNNNTEWESGDVDTRWINSLVWLEWNMGYSQITISRLSTEYVLVPISATKSGVAYNPTGDVVTMAFMPTAIQQPGLSDWMASSWDTDSTNIIYPYNVKCLVGPSGVITLNTGTYVIFVKIVDNPEIPVLQVGQLIVS
jgi:hypothetical protein